jgi:hypothetical protein
METTVRRPRPAWSTWTEAASVITFGPNLRKTLSIALLIGTVFFSMNQLAAVMAGQVTLVVGLKAALAYIVPFCVSNYGILAASRADAQSSSPERITHRQSNEGGPPWQLHAHS